MDEVIETEDKSGTFAVFKGTGAAKFSLIRPRRDQNGYISKNGAILLEAAPAVGKRPDGLPNYDWKQKISFAIGVSDITQLLDPTTEKLVHKTTDQKTQKDMTKTLNFKPGEGKYAGTYQMYLNTFTPAGNQSVLVPLTQGEYMVLQRLLVSSVSTLIGW